MLGELDAQRRAEATRARDEALGAKRQKHAGEAVAARQRQAALERPPGAGTMGAVAQPRAS